MRRLFIVGLFIICCLSIFLGGCNSNKATPKGQGQAGYEVQDYQGNRVTLSGKPQRIVSLSLGTDEILLSLVAPSRLVALTYLADDVGISNVVDSAKQVPGRVRANLEGIIALKPDLVIMADWQPIELIKSIKDAGIAVYVYKTPATIEEIKKVIKELASLVGEEPTGIEIVAKMDTELAGIAEKVKNIPQDKKLVVIRYTLMGATYGTGSLFDDMCKYAGVENGVSKAGGKTFEYLPKEKIIAVNPDILLLPGWDFAGKTDVNEFKKEVQNDPAFQSLSAIKNNKLVIMSDKNVQAVSQYITIGIKNIVALAYPEYLVK